MIKFRIIENKLDLDPKILLVDCFSRLYSLDIEHIRYIKYVFFVSDIEEDNPYANLDEADKVDLAKRECFGDEHYEFTEEEAEIVEECQEMYVKFNENADNRTVHTYDVTIDRMRKEMDKVPPEMLRELDQKTGKVCFTDNFDVHAKCLINIEKIQAAKEKAVGRLKKERKDVDVRGDKTIGLMGRGLLRRKKGKDNEKGDAA